MGQGYSGDVPPLVELVRSGNNKQKENAARALRSPAANGANKEEIASAGGIPPLVELVSSGNDFQKEKAAAALWNLSVNNAVNQEKIASAGGIPPLMELVSSGNDEQKNRATGALICLSANAANQDKIASAGGIPPLVELVKSGNDFQKEKAAAAMWNLSVNNAVNQEKIASAGGIPPLVELLTSGNDVQKEKAAGALWNLSLDKPELRNLIIAENGAVDYLANLALEGTQLQRENAAGVLGCLASYLPDDVKMKVATEGGIEALLLWIIRPENAESMHEGLIALQGLCTDGNDTVRAILKSWDGHVMLSSTVESGNEKNKMLADQILEWLADDFTKLSKQCQRMGEAEPLCSHVMERIKVLQDRGVDSGSELRTRVRAVLVMNGDKPMLVRILCARSLSETLADMHREIDLHEPDDVRGRWRSRWEKDKSVMMQKLFECDVPTLITSLGDASAQVEALTLLAHEVKQNKSAYTKPQRGFLQEFLIRLAGFSSGGIPDDEKWFIPRTDVPFADKAFNRGASGKVYHGKYMSADVVIKCVDIKTESDRTDFLREVNVWHESRHPNIVQLFGACHVGEPCFMVCKYISGGSSRVYLYEQRILGRECAWRVLLGVTRGLKLLHSKGIIHADLKGDNILVEGDTAMITDFGMSFFAAETQPDFGDLGAIRWRAPEFIATKRASFEADVYSLGMCIVEAVTGKLPWGIVPDSAVKAHLKRKTFLQQPESMSDAEWALVCAMCDFDPSNRMKLADVETRIREFADVEEEKEAIAMENAPAAG